MVYTFNTILVKITNAIKKTRVFNTAILAWFIGLILFYVHVSFS